MVEQWPEGCQSWGLADLTLAAELDRYPSTQVPTCDLRCVTTPGGLLRLRFHSGPAADSSPSGASFGGAASSWPRHNGPAAAL